MVFTRRGLRSGCSVVSLGALLACSSSSSEPSTANDGGGADGGGVGSSTETKQTGRAAVVQTATPIPGAVVSAGGTQATADADGNYAITVPRGKPITLKLSAPDHLQLIEQEYIVDAPSYIAVQKSSAKRPQSRRGRPWKREEVAFCDLLRLAHSARAIATRLFAIAAQ
ncbi:MAG: hypothetical protein HOO96_23815 [Polyangiaceae bacterium]|nr:hypothetical protein [Polyangiaceae bacterium]